jgi:hypothetical protein
MGPKRAQKNAPKIVKEKIHEGPSGSEKVQENEMANTFQKHFTLKEGEAYQDQTEDYSKPKIFVATPCYAGQVHVRYMESVISLSRMLSQNGIGMEFFSIPFDSLIPRARNTSITKFMNDDSSTHIIFIDSDIQFHPTSVMKMLKEDKDIIAGCYPKKAIDWETMHKNHAKTSNTVELIQSSVKYAYNMKPQRTHTIERGCVEVMDAPTGFLMIKKSAIREMIHAYPETEYVNDVGAYQAEGSRFFNLFQSQVFDGRYLSEDYGFCRLWHKMNKPIFADLTVKLNHIGQFSYLGDPLLHLKYSDSVEMTSKEV